MEVEHDISVTMSEEVESTYYYILVVISFPVIFVFIGLVGMGV